MTSTREEKKFPKLDGCLPRKYFLANCQAEWHTGKKTQNAKEE